MFNRELTLDDVNGVGKKIQEHTRAKKGSGENRMIIAPAVILSNAIPPSQNQSLLPLTEALSDFEKNAADEAVAYIPVMLADWNTWIYLQINKKDNNYVITVHEVSSSVDKSSVADSLKVINRYVKYLGFKPLTNDAIMVHGADQNDSWSDGYRILFEIADDCGVAALLFPKVTSESSVDGPSSAALASDVEAIIHPESIVDDQHAEHEQAKQADNAAQEQSDDPEVHANPASHEDSEANQDSDSDWESDKEEIQPTKQPARAKQEEHDDGGFDVIPEEEQKAKVAKFKKLQEDEQADQAKLFKNVDEPAPELAAANRAGKDKAKKKADAKKAERAQREQAAKQQAAKAKAAQQAKVQLIAPEGSSLKVNQDADINDAIEESIAIADHVLLSSNEERYFATNNMDEWHDKELQALFALALLKQTQARMDASIGLAVKQRQNDKISEIEQLIAAIQQKMNEVSQSQTPIEIAHYGRETQVVNSQNAYEYVQHYFQTGTPASQPANGLTISSASDSEKFRTSAPTTTNATIIYSQIKDRDNTPRRVATVLDKTPDNKVVTRVYHDANTDFEKIPFDRLVKQAMKNLLTHKHASSHDEPLKLSGKVDALLVQSYIVAAELLRMKGIAIDVVDKTKRPDDKKLRKKSEMNADKWRMVNDYRTAAKRYFQSKDANERKHVFAPNDDAQVQKTVDHLEVLNQAQAILPNTAELKKDEFFMREYATKQRNSYTRPSSQTTNSVANLNNQTDVDPNLPADATTTNQQVPPNTGISTTSTSGSQNTTVTGTAQNTNQVSPRTAGITATASQVEVEPALTTTHTHVASDVAPSTTKDTSASVDSTPRVEYPNGHMSPPNGTFNPSPHSTSSTQNEAAKTLSPTGSSSSSSRASSSSEQSMSAPSTSSSSTSVKDQTQTKTAQNSHRHNPSLFGPKAKVEDKKTNVSVDDQENKHQLGQ